MQAADNTHSANRDAGIESDTSAQFEDLRRETVAGLRTYETQLQRQIEEYRNQRAWQVMLVLRKAYTLLLQRGWQGKREFARWLLLDIATGRVGLAEYDLRFPDPWVYVPERLSQPIGAGAGTREATGPAASLTAYSPVAPHQYDVIMLPIFDFEFRFQRPQQLAVQFARAGHRVFWVSPSRMLAEGSAKAYEIFPIRHNIWEVNIKGPKLELYTGRLTDELAGVLQSGLDPLFRDAAIAESCVFLQFPFWRRLGLGLRKKWGACVVYDCMDDWQNWPTTPLISAGNLEDERALAHEADVLVVTAREFVERYESQGLQPLLAPNGTDFDFFHSAPQNDVLDNVPRPIIGYYGAIADWFDLDAVVAIAKERPGYSVVVIGQIHGCDVSALKRLPNVYLLGEKRYRDIPEYLRNFDVCLIPFLVTKLTKAVDPVKMYEYLSQGKPVVASYMPELLQYRDLLYLANSPAEFVEQVDRAVAERSHQACERRIEFARANTWRARTESIDARVRESFPRVSLIVLTYNSVEFMKPFHGSIERNGTYPNLEVVYVDNASTDGTAEELCRIAAGDRRVKLLLLERNLGFAGGNNAGVAVSTGEYLVIINPDTVLTRGCIGRLLQPLRMDPQVGMTAPVTNFSGNQTRIRTSYTNVHEMELFAEHMARSEATVTDVPAIPLLCGVISRELWDRVGGLDERFRVGMFEDDDFSLRLQECGYRTVMVENCFLHHFGNGSFGKVPSEESLRIFAANRQEFESKWKRSWVPHTTRPGVPPPGPADRMDVEAFMSAEAAPAAALARCPSIKRLIPAATEAGHGFHVQPDGTSAIIVECSDATPDAVVLWAGTPLHTTYGGSTLVTATVPMDFLSKPGAIQVKLATAFGESAPAEFLVCAEQ